MAERPYATLAQAELGETTDFSTLDLATKPADAKNAEFAWKIPEYSTAVSSKVTAR